MKGLVQELGDELFKKKDINGAITCFMVAQSIDIVVDLWKKRYVFLHSKKNMDRNEALFQLFQKVILFKTVCRQTTSIVDQDLVISDMADLMTSEDLRLLSMKYLDLANPKQANVALTKDRVFNSDVLRNKQGARPSPPYHVEKVRVQMSIAQQQNQ